MAEAMAVLGAVPVEIWVALLGILQVYLNKSQEQRNEAYRKTREKAEADREEVQWALVSAVLASLEASEVTTIALKGGHLNGNVDHAREEVVAARHRLRELASRAMAGTI